MKGVRSCHRINQSTQRLLSPISNGRDTLYGRAPLVLCSWNWNEEAFSLVRGFSKYIGIFFCNLSWLLTP